ncbi:MAG: DUF4383 domain-containing protein [Pseudonocardiales bacterium]|nr:DUF4383 domain-containing protein [Pseudonocardiales bacterium]MBV9028848.1 DUF4383 domain-containing protein [Pseudonocardiales bacterium]
MTFASPEDKFGIKLQPRRVRTLEQNASMVLGSIYFVGGVIGFYTTGFSNPTELVPGRAFLGIFMLNPYHNIVHIAVGLLWFLGAFALTAAGNEGLNIAIAGVYTLATVIGFMGYLTLLAITPTDPDNYLHLVTAAVTIVFGTGLLRVFGGRRAVTA